MPTLDLVLLLIRIAWPDLARFPVVLKSLKNIEIYEDIVVVVVLVSVARKPYIKATIGSFSCITNKLSCHN